jgi:6-phosphogluconate dehydrogenase
MIEHGLMNVYDIGMIGLGVMGRNLMLNMADHGFTVAGFGRDQAKMDALNEQTKYNAIWGTADLNEFIDILKKPRNIILLVPAGNAVDSVIVELVAVLEPGDLIIDGGNSWFKDSERRENYLKGKGILFMGMGVSGGEEGARHGPSIMPGGSCEAYERVRPVLEAVSAKVKDEPCVTYIGKGSSGHFVKMMHNGIEYALMQMISETYDLMKQGLGLSNPEIGQVYTDWNKTELNSYLIEITSYIFNKTDDQTHKPMIDVILGVARQKGTGMWTSQSAMELQVPAPSIDISVSMRDLSAYEDQRLALSKLLKRPHKNLDENPDTFLKQLKHAYYVSMLLAYAQGFAVLAKASESYHYDLNLAEVSRIWRGGCIIRSAALDEIRRAFTDQPGLSNLLLDQEISKQVMIHSEDLRKVVIQAIDIEIPIPGLMASLGYFDACRSSWLPANLIQAQRDYFGAHTYERVDMKGIFHTQWE